MNDDYIDQDGNALPLCVTCGYWAATHGAQCEACADWTDRHAKHAAALVLASDGYNDRAAAAIRANHPGYKTDATLAAGVAAWCDDDEEQP